MAVVQSSQSQGNQKQGRSMITIHGDAISGNCLKVKWTAERLAIPFTWIDVNVVKRETRTDSFLAMNPAGQVPVIVLEDDRPLAQSNAIILYLAEGSALIPADAYQRAKMLEWMFWEHQSKSARHTRYGSRTAEGTICCGGALPPTNNTSLVG
jgi:glutathione S-transferase